MTWPHENLRKYHSPGEIPDEYIRRTFSGEDHTVNVGPFAYRNVNIVSFDGKAYIVSHKAVLTVSITPTCNANCSFCYNGITFFPGWGPVDVSPEVERVIQFCTQAGVRRVSLSGGEPTLAPDAVLSLLSRVRGQFSDFVRLHTNGTRLMHEYRRDGREDPLYVWLKEYGLSDISISMAHVDEKKNAAIMQLPDGTSLSASAVRELLGMFPDLRLSCYVHPEGISSPYDMMRYIDTASGWGVKRFVFRISSELPDEASLPTQYMVGNRALVLPTDSFGESLANAGFKVEFRRKEVDYDLFIFRNHQNIEVSVDRSSDISDPDRKIRRLNLMPNGVCYTSWVDPTSVLFPEDIDRVALTGGGPMKFGSRFPAHRDRRTFYSSSQAAYADLHVHSLVSDGWKRPSSIVDDLVEAGIRHAVFVEHNGVNAEFDRLRTYASRRGLDIPFPGCEVSAVYAPTDSEEVYRFHLLLFGEGLRAVGLGEWLGQANEVQNEHIRQLYHGFQTAHGGLADFADVYSVGEVDECGQPSKVQFTRRPLAIAIARRLGITESEAKERFLPATPSRKYDTSFSVEEVISRAVAAGCVAIVAHPAWVRDFSKSGCGSFEGVLRALWHMRSMGLDGIEVFHRTTDATSRLRLLHLAASTDMLVTGGSDYHGRPTDSLGSFGTGEGNFERLQYLLNIRSNVKDGLVSGTGGRT